jgi:hypothetical protein
MKFFLGDVIAKVEGQLIFKPTVGNVSLPEIGSDNGVRIVNFATSRNLSVESSVFLHPNMHELDLDSGRETHNEIDQVFIDKRQHSDMSDVQSFIGADCDTDHYLVIAKVRERLSVSKRAEQKFDVKRINPEKLKDKEDKEQIHLHLVPRSKDG